MESGVDHRRVARFTSRPDGVKIARKVYSWIDFDEAEAMIPGEEPTQ